MKTLASLLLAAASLLPGHGNAMTPQEAQAAQRRITADYQAARAQCQPLRGHARSACQRAAEGDAAVARAELRARRQPTAENHYKVRIARAQADRRVAGQKCQALDGHARDVCRQDARAAYVTARENAKVARAMAAPEQTRIQQEARVAEARRDATAEKNEALRQAAAERCDALAAVERTRCLTAAQRRFGTP